MPTAPPHSPWLTPAEAAIHLRISRSQLNELIRDRKVPAHYQLGPKSPRFHREELDAWLLGSK